VPVGRLKPLIGRPAPRIQSDRTMEATLRPPCAFAAERCQIERSRLVKPALRDDRGFLHSMQTGSVVDGPGMRTVLWTTGCLLRCLYCHNPDTWHMKDGKPITP
jgi:uncharacterized Fe-S radical SAM superfamily protein PflX